MNLDEYVTDLQRRTDLLETKVGVDTTPSIGNWKTPTLTNSWLNYGSGWQDAQYARDNSGWVHIRGFVKLGSEVAPAFTLPVGYRPDIRKYTKGQNAGAPGVFYVNTDGTVMLTPSVFGGNNSWVGINYSFNTPDAIKIPFEFRGNQGRSWVTWPPTDITQYGWPAMLPHKNGMIQSTGLVTGGVSATSVMWPIGSEYTLDRVSLFGNIAGTAGVWTRIDIGHGTFFQWGTGSFNTSWCSLEGFIWPGPGTRGKWTDLTLLAGNTAFGDEYHTPAYYKDPSGWVHLKGMLRGGTLTSGTGIATLPAGFCPPAHGMHRGQTEGPATQLISIMSSGGIALSGNANGWLSLDGIHFHTTT